jgi:hypothetical protein
MFGLYFNAFSATSGKTFREKYMGIRKHDTQKPKYILVIKRL